MTKAVTKEMWWAAGVGPAKGQKSGADYRAHTSPSVWEEVFTVMTLDSWGQEVEVD